MCNLGFHQVLEGLLGEGNYVPELLFVLREPHSDNETHFWFKEDVVIKAYSELKGAEKRYFNVLSSLAQKAFVTREMDKSFFERCAYMNLHPFYGGRNRSEKYFKILEAMDSKDVSLDECASAFFDIDTNCTPNVIAKHRIGIIQRAIDSGVKNIITTEDIYNTIKKIWNVQEEEEEKFFLKYNYRKRKNSKEFRACYLGETKETRVISFWHPSCTLINDVYLKEVQIP